MREQLRRLPANGCTWCGHPRHESGECDRMSTIRTYPDRSAKPVDITVPCPCERKTS